MNEETTITQTDTVRGNPARKLLKRLYAAFTAALLAENEWYIYNAWGDNPNVANRVKAESEYEAQKRKLCENLTQNQCVTM